MDNSNSMSDILNMITSNPDILQKVMSILPMITENIAPAPSIEPQPIVQPTPPDEEQLSKTLNSILSAFSTITPPAAVPEPAPAAPPSLPQAEAATPTAAFDIEKTLGVLKNVTKETSPEKDNRIKLLIALKPFMKDGRKQKIDMAVKYLNAAKVFNMFGKSGFI